jgi:hypothetical protein
MFQFYGGRDPVPGPELQRAGSRALRGATARALARLDQPGWVSCSLPSSLFSTLSA